LRLRRRSRKKPPRRRVERRAKPARRTGRRFPDLGGVDVGKGAPLVVGLGNPGRNYRHTRHNAGRTAAERILEKSELVAVGDWQEGYVAVADYSGRRFLVMIPGVFMNISGRAVAPVVWRYGVVPDRVVVIHDDIDIPLGEVRVKRGGGTGGHLGLASMVEALGDEGFSRVRVGVGRPPVGVDPADYVLSSLPEEEVGEYEASIERAAEAALEMVMGENDGAD
jgi:PTH1 family peptidyl-tRNA hydrolase